MATVTEKGRISFKSDVQSGTSQKGFNWARQTIVIDIPSFNGQYRQLALIAQNDGVQAAASLPVGTEVEVKYSVTSRNWQGKWFTNADLFRIEAVQAQQTQTAPAQPSPYPAAPAPQPIPTQGQMFNPEAPADEDLPF